MVRFSDEYDLRGTRAYADADFRRVWLCRRPVSTGDEREGIFVLPAEPEESFGEAVGKREPLGMLRPVQRYVLRAGLQRAKQIQAALDAHLGDRGDRSGFRARAQGRGSEAGERDAADRRAVCTGWTRRRSRRGLRRLRRQPSDRADRLEGTPRDCGGRGGGRTRRALLCAPLRAHGVGGHLRQRGVRDTRAGVQYLARSVDRAKLETRLAAVPVEDAARRDELKARLQSAADRDLYRRWFRDLETGFGYLGGQGGRFVKAARLRLRGLLGRESRRLTSRSMVCERWRSPLHAFALCAGMPLAHAVSLTTRWPSSVPSRSVSFAAQRALMRTPSFELVREPALLLPDARSIRAPRHRLRLPSPPDPTPALPRLRRRWPRGPAPPVRTRRRRARARGGGRGARAARR